MSGTLTTPPQPTLSLFDHPEAYMAENGQRIAEAIALYREDTTEAVRIGCSDTRLKKLPNTISSPGTGLLHAMQHRKEFNRIIDMLGSSGHEIIVQTHDNCLAMEAVAQETGQSAKEVRTQWRDALVSQLGGAKVEHIPLSKMGVAPANPPIYVDTTGAFDPALIQPGQRISVVTPNTWKDFLLKNFGRFPTKKYFWAQLEGLLSVLRSSSQSSRVIDVAVVCDSQDTIISEEVLEMIDEARGNQNLRVVAFNDKGKIVHAKVKLPSHLAGLA